MPATDYPELQGMPAGCTEMQPWDIDGIDVLVPYADVDDVAIYQEPLISINWPAEKYEMFAGDEAYDQDIIGGLGYKGVYEMEVFNMLRPMASATANNTAFYHPEAKDAIVTLATEAYDLLEEIRDIYAKYESPNGSVTYKLKKTGGRPASSVFFPLSVPDQDVLDSVDLNAVGLSVHMRDVDRANIRSHYHKAIYLLWCALYGQNQSLSWRENRNIYMKEHQPSGPGLAAPGTTPPQPPGADFPQVWPTPTPPPPPPGGMLSPVPAEPPTGGYDVQPIPTEPGGGGGAYPGYEPGDQGPTPPPTKRKKSSGGGIAIALGLGVAALVLAKK